MLVIGILGADDALCGDEGGAFGHSGGEVFEKFGHQQLRRIVKNFPKAHYDGLGTSFFETALQSENAFARYLA